MRVLAIDPGADQGWSVLERGVLVACGLGEPEAPRLSLGYRLVIERPHTYGTKARPKDLVTLALRAGEAGGRYGRTFGIEPEYFEPVEWKGGSIPKEIHHPRIWAKLSAAEQEIVSAAARGMAPGKRHNMLDAIGIGLFAVGRRA